MNTTFEIISHNASSIPEFSNEESLMATGFVALATLAVAAMQQCASTEKAKTEPLRISIPPNVDSAPQTPSPPAAPVSTRKKIVVKNEDELDQKIIRFLRFNPGSTVKEMLKTFKTKDASLTKSDINSRLYTMLKKSSLRKEGDTGAPNWYLN